MHKCLPVFLLLAGYCAKAKDNLKLSDNAEQLTIVSQTMAAMNPVMPGATATSALYGRRSEHSVHFFYSIELGYGSGTAATDSTKVKKGGFAFRGDLGAKIELKNADTRTSFLSFSLGGGATNMLNANFNVVTLPISYSSLSFGRQENAKAFYWQIGVNLDYLYSVKANDVTITSHFNKEIIEPMASFGLNVPFRIINRRSRETVGGGRVSVGPYFSYVVNNMSADPGITVHAYKIGFKWSYIFM